MCCFQFIDIFEGYKKGQKGFSKYVEKKWCSAIEYFYFRKLRFFHWMVLSEQIMLLYNMVCPEQNEPMYTYNVILTFKYDDFVPTLYRRWNNIVCVQGFV